MNRVLHWVALAVIVGGLLGSVGYLAYELVIREPIGEFR